MTEVFANNGPMIGCLCETYFRYKYISKLKEKSKNIVYQRNINQEKDPFSKKIETLKREVRLKFSSVVNQLPYIHDAQTVITRINNKHRIILFPGKKVF